MEFRSAEEGVYSKESVRDPDSTTKPRMTSMTHRALATVFAILGLSGCAHRQAADEIPSAEERVTSPVYPSTLRITQDTTVLAGELAGTVKSDAGAPVRRAQLTITSLKDGTQHATTATDEGVFRFNALTLGRAVLNVNRIGYSTVVDTIALKPGMAVHLTVQANPVCFCDPPMHPPALTAWVRDAQTRRAPKALVTLRLEEGSYVDSVQIVLPDASSDRALQMEISSCRPGTYEVRVSAPGYKDWSVNRVKVSEADCARFAEKKIRVFLQPLSDTTRRLAH